MSIPDCYTAAIRILNFRFNSEAELRRKLRKKEFDAESIEATIARLRDEKWLDDARFAAGLVRAKSSKKVGRRRIAQALGAAGVAGEDISQAIEENLDRDDERAAVAALCRKKIDALERRHGANFAASDEARQKAAAFAIRKGFETHLVLEVLGEILRRR